MCVCVPFGKVKALTELPTIALCGVMLIIIQYLVVQFMYVYVHVHVIVCACVL